MKKFIASILIVSLLLTPTITFADEVSGGSINNISSFEINEDSLSKIKSIFEIPKEFNKVDFSKSVDNYGISLNYYNWNFNESSISVVTDDKENIISYNYNEPNKYKKHLKIKSKDEIKKISDEFIKKIDPSLLKSYRQEEIKLESGQKFSSVIYYRYVNNIKVLNDTLRIFVDLSNNKVTHFNRTSQSLLFNDSDFADPKLAISSDDAIDLILKKYPMNLGYVISKNDENPKAIPAYFQNFPNNTIDAINKNFIEYNSSNMDLKAEGSADEHIVGFASNLTKEEVSEVEKFKKLKPLKDVEKYIQKDFNLKDYKINYYNLYKNFDTDSYMYSLEILQGDKSYNISVDANNLNLLSYSDYSYLPDDGEKVSKEKAIEISNAFIEKHNSFENVDLSNPIVSSVDDYSISICYPRMENGLFVFEEGLFSRIAHNVKDISNYSAFMKKTDFEKIENPKEIDTTTLKELYKEKFGFNLYYSYINNTPVLIYSTNVNSSNVAPIIRYKDNAAIDFNGVTYGENFDSYKNIEESKYKDEIEFLKDFEIYIPKNLDLKSNISIGDFIYLLSKLDSGETYSKAYIQTLMSDYYFENIEDIKDKNLERDIYNKDAVKWLMNMCGYRYLQTSKNVFDKSVFTDSNSIPDEYRAYYYLASSLGIYDYADALPNSALTVEEAFHLIYNSITK